MLMGACLVLLCRRSRTAYPPDIPQSYAADDAGGTGTYGGYGGYGGYKSGSTRGEMGPKLPSPWPLVKETKVPETPELPLGGGPHPGACLCPRCNRRRFNAD